ncbi:hypothetical protein NH340_JMT04871 [Sarcoptes scabiei]|nr:hypothetical protein NH340_JMT04871 [Sarcoptes scabiei]
MGNLTNITQSRACRIISLCIDDVSNASMFASLDFGTKSGKWEKNGIDNGIIQWERGIQSIKLMFQKWVAFFLFDPFHLDHLFFLFGDSRFFLSIYSSSLLLAKDKCSNKYRKNFSKTDHSREDILYSN